MSSSGLHYAAVRRDDLGDALRGGRPSNMIPFLESQLLPRLSSRDALVFWSDNSRRPCMIGVNSEGCQELFNWAVTYHRDLAPLTSWCHVVDLKEISMRSGMQRSEESLHGLEAAWTGAVIAEAMALSRRSYDLITLPACLATDTFAIARTVALYGVKAISETIEQFDNVRDRLRRPVERWRPATGHFISVLSRLVPGGMQASSSLVDLLSRLCRDVHLSSDAGKHRFPPQLTEELASRVPQLAMLDRIGDIPAEERVRLLRETANWLASAKNDEDRHLLYFAAGYIISRVGGAERDLRLAEAFDGGYPNVLTWSAVLGGLGLTPYWTDAFGGIGRLVARELTRPFRLMDPPCADIAADEMLVISDKSPGQGPLRFRTGQRSVAAVAIRPGVVVQVSLSEEEKSYDRGREPHSVSTKAGLSAELRDPRYLELLAEQLFPYLQKIFLRSERGSRKGRSPELPLK